MREAPSIVIINELTTQGMHIRAFDLVANNNARRIFKNNPLVEVTDEQYAACNGCQALLVVTEWNQFRNPDFDRLKRLLTAPVSVYGADLHLALIGCVHADAYVERVEKQHLGVIVCINNICSTASVTSTQSVSIPVPKIPLPFFLKETIVPVYRQKGLELVMGSSWSDRFDIDLLINF